MANASAWTAQFALCDERVPAKEARALAMEQVMAGVEVAKTYEENNETLVAEVAKSVAAARGVLKDGDWQIVLPDVRAMNTARSAEPGIKELINCLSPKAQQTTVSGATHTCRSTLVEMLKAVGNLADSKVSFITSGARDLASDIDITIKSTQPLKTLVALRALEKLIFAKAHETRNPFKNTGPSEPTSASRLFDINLYVSDFGLPRQLSPDSLANQDCSMSTSQTTHQASVPTSCNWEVAGPVNAPIQHAFAMSHILETSKQLDDIAATLKVEVAAYASAALFKTMNGDKQVDISVFDAVKNARPVSEVDVTTATEVNLSKYCTIIANDLVTFSCGKFVDKTVNALSHLALYEDDCYHTQGAFMHVVKEIQQGLVRKLPHYMYRDSLVENLYFALCSWGNDNKVGKYLCRAQHAAWYLGIHDEIVPRLASLAAVRGKPQPESDVRVNPLEVISGDTTAFFASFKNQHGSIGQAAKGAKTKIVNIFITIVKTIMSDTRQVQQAAQGGGRRSRQPPRGTGPRASVSPAPRIAGPRASRHESPVRGRARVTASSRRSCRRGA
jgi:hypothetical protein